MSQPQQAMPPRPVVPPAPTGPGTPTAAPESSQLAQLWAAPDRRTVMFLSLGAAIVFIVLLTIIFPKDSHGAEILTDHSKYSHFPYPFTIQNLEHLLFFVGLGELFVRWRSRDTRA